MSNSLEAPTNPTRELAAIMFSDIAGYTAIMGRDEQKAIRALEAHRELLRSILPRFNGRMLGEIGDGTLTSFHSAVDAVHCAREVQTALQDDPQLRLRIGIHVGDVLFRDNTALGDGVNVASRIHALAPPGGICISERVFEDIRNKPEIRARDLGNKTLKNVDHPIRVFLLEPDGVAATIVSSSARRWGMRLAGISAVAMIAGVIAIVIARSHNVQSPGSKVQSSGAPESAKVTLAVLPFANLSGSKDDEYFSDGITDEIRGDLSKIAELQVIARTSSYAFKGQNEDVKKIAGLLHVRNLLDGSVQRTADKIRIEVELIDASNGFTVWSDRYDEKLADVFQIQSDVAESVAANLKVKLLGSVRQRVDKKPTDNLEAYNLYLQGNYYFAQFTEQGADKAIGSYRRAIAQDPNFAQAYEGLGCAYEEGIEGTMSPREAAPKARAALEKALALDENLSDAHACLGYLSWMYDWNWTAAGREMRQAEIVDPSNPGANHAYGDLLLSLGRYNEALREKLHARELDPLEVEWTVEIGDVYRESRQYDRAIESYNESIAMAPDFYGGYLGRALSYAEREDFSAAVPDGEKALQLANFPGVEGALGFLYGSAGRRDAALKILDHLQELSKHRYVPAFYISSVYFGLKDGDRAFQWLEKSCEDRSPNLLGLKGPIWDPVRSDRRFQAIYKKVGLPP